MTSISSNQNILIIATMDDHLWTFHLPTIEMLQKHGKNVHIATNFRKGLQTDFLNLGVTCHEISFCKSPYSLVNFKALIQVIRLMKNNNFDLVHTHTPMGAIIGRFASFLTKTRPVLYTAHGFHFHTGAPIINWVIYYTVERLMTLFTDGLITINSEDYERAKTFWPLSNKKIFYINGVGVTEEKIDKKNIDFEIPENHSLCLFTAAEFNSNKNHIQLLKALKTIKENTNHQIHVYFAGVGEGRNALEDYIKESNLTSFVHFLGYRRDVPLILNLMDVFVLTSKREGLPRSIMEAHIMGKPTICNNIRGCRDLIKDGENGYLVEIDDYKTLAKKIIELAEDKNKLKELGDNARKMITPFKAENILKDLQVIYKSYLNDF